MPGQPITYSLKYSSTTGQPATRSEIDIDGVPYTMTTSGGDYTKGVTYTFTIPSLPIGVHFCRFVFDDGSGSGSDFLNAGDTPSVTPVVLSQSSVSPAGITRFSSSSLIPGQAGLTHFHHRCMLALPWERQMLKPSRPAQLSRPATTTTPINS